MKQFSGFPSKMQFTSIPNPFFSILLPQISDIAELKTTLHFLSILYRKRGYPRIVTHSELAGDTALISSLNDLSKPPQEALCDALEMATKRGTILHLALEKDGTSEDIYFLNTDKNVKVIAKIKSGELSPTGLTIKEQAYARTEEQPDIFTLYEQNIGMLTPMIAEELRDAEKQYPTTWIIAAVKEAVSLNKRQWRYIARILERWSIEGRSNGAYQRDFAEKTDPDKYIRGKYGHMVGR
jgi:DnaD/phage-associated family protein